MTTNNSNAPTVQPTREETFNPFTPKTTNRDHANIGTIEIEAARAVAEVKGKLLIAQQMPRNEQAAYATMMQSCSRYNFADQAMYTFPRGGKSVSGPSIRMAEELVRCWGNIEYGIRELSRRDGESEMQAYAIDMERNVHSYKNFTVRHLRDKKGGPEVLTDERDIYEITANMGGRRVRACILSILPADYVDDATAMCAKTLAEGTTNVPLVDRVKQMLISFQKYGVSNDMIEKRLDKKTTELFPEDLADMLVIRNSIRDGQSKPEDWFGDKTANATAAGASGDKPSVENLKNKKKSDQTETPKTETKETVSSTGEQNKVDTTQVIKDTKSETVTQNTATAGAVEKTPEAPITDDNTPIL